MELTSEGLPDPRPDRVTLHPTMFYVETERHFTHSLRFKVAIGVALPVFLALGTFSALQHLRERQVLLDRLEDTAIRLGEVMRDSLRHAMLTRNQDELQKMLVDIGRQESVLRVAILNAQGEIRVSNRPQDFTPPPDRDAPGCAECHRASGVPERHSLIIRLPGQAPFLRNRIPIPNEPACYECHAAAQRNLGVLIADFSLSGLEHAFSDLQVRLGLSALVTVLVTAGVYGLVHALIVRRVERFQRPLHHFAQGDFSERVLVAPREGDELGELASAVNRMAEGLGHEAELERRAREARQMAIVEERQRLARELHDGIAQIVGYVSTKAMAVRLLVQRGEHAEAAKGLRQIEAAARDVYTDLRAAILDLKTTVNSGGRFVPTLTAYVERFREQSGIPTDLTLGAGADALGLSPERELQFLRIVQEALTNVRKHAGASHAWVRLDSGNGEMASMVIGDDGCGFDPAATERGHTHFGLCTMRERAEAIGGKLSVETAPGAGTRITVVLPQRGDESHFS
jgi:signal transduction histidine kinase